MDTRLDLRDAFAIIREHVDTLWPGHLGITILVDVGRGEPARLPVPNGRIERKSNVPGRGDSVSLNGDSVSLNAGTMSPRELAVLEVFNEIPPEEVLTGQEVADRAGFVFCGSFRQILAKLVRDNHIVGGRNGYSRRSNES